MKKILIFLFVFLSAASLAFASDIKVTQVPVNQFEKDKPVTIEALPSNYTQGVELTIQVIHEGSFIKETVATFKLPKNENFIDVGPYIFEKLTLKPGSNLLIKGSGKSFMVIDSGKGSTFTRTKDGKGLILTEGEALLAPWNF